MPQARCPYRAFCVETLTELGESWSGSRPLTASAGRHPESPRSRGDDEPQFHPESCETAHGLRPVIQQLQDLRFDPSKYKFLAIAIPSHIEPSTSGGVWIRRQTSGLARDDSPMRTNLTPSPEDSPFRSKPLIYAVQTIARVLAGLSLAGVVAIGPLLGADTDQAKPSSTGSIRLTAGQENLPEVGVSVSSSVNEDSGQVVNIAFSRTGSTSGPLEVAYTVGGTATPGIDYTGLATAPAVRTIRFEIGEFQHVLALSPVADSEPEPGETIVVRLATGSDYRINTPQASAFGRILNDDPWRNPTSLRMIETLPGSAPSRGSPLSGYQPGWLTPAGDRLFFIAFASGNIGGLGVGERELCWTDGLTNYRTGIRQLSTAPAAGTISLQVPSSDIRTLLPRLGDSVFFIGYDSRGWNLWRHDGINATLIKDFLPNRLDPGFGGTPAPFGLIAAGGKPILYGSHRPARGFERGRRARPGGRRKPPLAQ